MYLKMSDRNESLHSSQKTFYTKTKEGKLAASSI